MIELFFLILQFFILYFLLSMNLFVVYNKGPVFNNFSFSENISFNSIIFLNFILIVSFFNVNLKKIIIYYFLYLFFLLLIYLYKFKGLVIKLNQNLFYFIILFVTSCVIFIEVANNLVIGWDAQKFWIYKTLNFYNGNTIDNLTNLPNPWYPYLGSLAWSFFWKVSFLENEYSGRLFYVFIYLSSLLVIINNLKLSIFYKIIFFIFFIIISYDYTLHSHWSIFSGFQEILNFSLLTMAIHFLFKISSDKKNLVNFNLLSILLICNLLVWVKLEGFVISLSLILTLLLFFNFKIKKKITILTVYLTIILLRFFIFDFYNLNSTDTQHIGFDHQNLFEFFTKLSLSGILIVLKFLFLNFFTNYLTLISFFILIIFLITKQNFKKIYYVLFLAVFNIVFFCGIYLTSSLDLTWMLKTGMDRIIYQLSPISFLFILEFYNSKIIKKNN